MRNFLNIVLHLIVAIYSFLSRQMKDYVIPTINFIENIKFLLFTKDYSKKDFNFRQFFIDKLGIAEHYIDKLLELFIRCIRIILPNEIEGNTFEEGLRSFLAYLHTLKDGQKALLYFKLASLIIYHWINDAPNRLTVKEHETDFMVQLAYTKIKLSNKSDKIPTESMKDKEENLEDVKEPESKTKVATKKTKK